MAYRVRVSPSALSDAEQSYLWMLEQYSEALATRLYSGLIDAVYSLENFPVRCPLSPEAEDLGKEIRQLLYGKRSATYRILFAIEEEDGEEIVHVFRIWHGARDRIRTEDISE